MTTSWHRLTAYAKPHRLALTGLILLSLVIVALEAIMPWPMKLIIDHVLEGRPMPALLTWVHALPGAQPPAGLLAWLAFAILALFMAVRLVGLVIGIIQTSLTGRMKHALAGGVFDSLQRLSLTYHRRMHKGDLLRRVLHDTDCLPALITGALMPAFTALISLCVFFWIMLKLDTLLACVSLVVAIPMIILMRVLGHRMTERAYEQQEKEGQVWSVAEQSLASLPVIQAFGREEHESRRFQSVADGTIRASLRTVVTQLQFKIGLDGSQAVGVALIMLLGGWHAYHGELSVGSLVVFLSYLASLYAPLNTLAYLSSTLASAAASARRVLQVFDADERVCEAPDAKPMVATTHGRAGDICFDNVSFGYAVGNPVLRGINLNITAGETVALIGATGAGKTTLVSLIPRLFDPWQGVVSVGGNDVATVRIADVRSRVAFVLQDPVLLPLSIAENIAYGRPGASRREITAAAVTARADAFIRKLPSGYDTIIGERGATLSGGERQRIAIARALLKDAPILILDEPTSALDVETESLFIEALNNLMIGRTTIIIAHRLSTIRMADRVVLLEGGRLQEISVGEVLRTYRAATADRQDRSS